jgi:hypothetical protein
MATSYKDESDQITTLLRSGSTRFQDIKDDLFGNSKEMIEDGNAEDRFHEYADSWLPVYYNEILVEWGKMPHEFTDSWKDQGYTEDKGIFALMSMDLFNWYYSMVEEAWAEILEEREEN